MQPSVPITCRARANCDRRGFRAVYLVQIQREQEEDRPLNHHHHEHRAHAAP
jgi:hypothetical protein